MTTSYIPETGTKVTILGWGLTEDGTPSTNLKVTKITVVPKKICSSTYELEKSDGIFCAQDPTTDSCSGDSGGPAVYGGQLVGIVAGGGECGASPAVYTSVAYYEDWIQRNLFVSNDFNEMSASYNY